MATDTKQTTEVASARPKASEQIAAISPPRLPYHPAIEERFGVDKASWKALVEAIFPNATSTESVILALSYCRARKLDPFKRCVHIVPIYNSEMRRYVDTVWPGIGELRITAFRTGEYAGRGDTQYGPDVTMAWASGDGSVEVTFPEWAQVTVKRLVKGHIVDFSGPRVYWLETYATRKHNDDAPNTMWRDRPRGQIEKCAEAAALRAAFPEEIGSDYIPEEVEHRRSGLTIDAVPDKPRTVEELMEASENAKPLGVKDHTGPMPSDKELADREAAEQAKEAEPSQDQAKEQPTG